MLLPETFPAALAMMLVSMACWGSWTNAWRLARRWRLEFFHCDYAIGVMLAAAAAALTAGMLFGQPDFLDNLRTASPAAMGYAVAGGACLNIGNFLLMAAIARVGMTVAFPVAVGFSLVVGTVLSYLVHPLGDPALLGGGVAMVFCAVLVNSLVYRSASAGKQHGRGGLAMCLAAGVLFSLCGPLVAKALTAPDPVAPYGAAVLYAGGSLLITAPLFVWLLRRPIEGKGPLALAGYLGGSARNHLAGLAGGVVWGSGMVLNFIAAGLAGMAVAGAIGQANPLVAAAWGIFVWREFRGAPRRTHALLALMIALYSGGLALLSLSFRNV
jgi:glucose uptake protein